MIGGCCVDTLAYGGYSNDYPLGSSLSVRLTGHMRFGDGPVYTTLPLGERWGIALDMGCDSPGKVSHFPRIVLG